MQLWQFNAYCEAYQERQTDDLSIQLQAAYYEAYWNGAAKHKKSLSAVLKEIRKASSRKQTKYEPIDVEQVSKQFELMEALCKNGSTKV